MESDVVTLQDIFVARPPDEETAQAMHGMRLLGSLNCSGLKPHFLEKMAANGVTMPPTFFAAEDDSGLRQSFAAGSFGGGARA
jgi:pilus assembly protein CpaF